MNSSNILTQFKLPGAANLANSPTLSDHLDLHLKACQVEEKKKQARTAKNIFVKSTKLRHFMNKILNKLQKQGTQ